MTIEIKQLVIRAVVQPDREAVNSGRPAPSHPAREPADDENEALVARCVREVLRALERSRGR